MQLKFGDYNEGFGATLLCPKCGSNYLHHNKVEVFDCSQDATTNGVHVTVTDGATKIDTLLTGNPSRRRNGLTINLWCEGCSAKSIISISQHKGATQIDINYSENTN